MTTTSTAPDATQLYRGGDWGLLVQTQLPELISQQVYITDPDPANPETEPPLGTELATCDGRSWAQVHHDPGLDGTHTVTQAGPRQLRDEIEALRRSRDAAGRPDPRPVDGHWRPVR